MVNKSNDLDPNLNLLKVKRCEIHCYFGQEKVWRLEFSNNFLVGDFT